MKLKKTTKKVNVCTNIWSPFACLHRRARTTCCPVWGHKELWVDRFILGLRWAEYIKHRGPVGQWAGLHPGVGEKETGCARKKGGANCFPSATGRTPDTMSQSSQGSLAMFLLYIGWIAWWKANVLGFLLFWEKQLNPFVKSIRTEFPLV